ncbi:MAG: ATP-binding cassette domain-containing protein [Spirochaetaceae bacterium]|jgi:ABC-2 type transport system ATP-binding protein|nr:ATP-binding cassette domain-containing protein [Spirochaetaceae bacterium]
MIKVQNLTKRYGAVEAVKNVSFEVGAEQVVGFLGPNGAGKTTLMKILTGFHFPTAGKALIDGIDVQEDPVSVKARIGYLPEGVPLYSDLTVSEYLSFIADARRIKKSRRTQALQTSLELCGLSAVAHKKIETLSKGYKQRTGLAQAIIHDPPLLILDEPTSGLDPNQIIEIRNLITTLGTHKTVILSTHILQEVEAVCNTVLIINDGSIAAQGRPEDIAAGIKEADRWELVIKGATLETVQEQCARLGATLHSAKAGGGKAAAAVDTLTITVSVPHAGDGELIFDWAVREGLKIIGMNRKKVSLEDIFVRLTTA